METLLKMFLKFVVLVAATACSLIGNVQDIPPCCPQPHVQCQPIHCPKLPCCHPSSSDTKP